MKFRIFPFKLRDCNLVRSALWLIESKASFRSMNTVRVALFCWCALRMSLSRLTMPSRLENPDLKPYWLESINEFLSRYLFSLMLTILSIILQSEFVREIGLYEDVSDGGLLDL